MNQEGKEDQSLKAQAINSPRHTIRNLIDMEIYRLRDRLEGLEALKKALPMELSRIADEALLNLIYDKR
jgi:hypothetical protein